LAAHQVQASRSQSSRTEPLSEALIQPDEAYRNGRGGIHVFKRFDGEHFLAVICEPTDNEGLVRTAYLTTAQRKERRHQRLLCLKRS